MKVIDARSPWGMPLAATALMFALAGCGGSAGGAAGVASGGGANGGPTGGGPTGGGTAGPMGTISIAFGDAPPPQDEFAHAIVRISEIRLTTTSGLPEDDVVVLAKPIDIDLLALSGFAEVLVSRDVPIDPDYYAVRLQVEALTLVRQDGSRERAELAPGNGPQKDGATIFAFQWVGGTEPGFKVPPKGSGRLLVDVDIPLDIALHRADGKYSLSPFATLHVTGQGGPAMAERSPTVYRIAGVVDDIVRGDGSTVQSDGIKVCDLRSESSSTRPADPQTACVFVSVGDRTALFDAEAEVAPNGLDDVVLNDMVVAYGHWDDSPGDDNDVLNFYAAVVAVGSTFERARGAASAFDATTEQFAMNAANPDCASGSPAVRVGAVDAVPVFRWVSFIGPVYEFDEGWSRSSRGAVTECAAAVVEGYRVAADQIRSFVVLAHPQTLLGVLAESASAAGRYDLTGPDSTITCVTVDDATGIGAFDYVAWGPTFWSPVLSEVLAREVTVVGERTVDGCVHAERIIASAP
jgi:Domain of unknown function (DUF4382)